MVFSLTTHLMILKINPKKISKKIDRPTLVFFGHVTRTRVIFLFGLSTLPDCIHTVGVRECDEGCLVLTRPTLMHCAVDIARSVMTQTEIRVSMLHVISRTDM